MAWRPLALPAPGVLALPGQFVAHSVVAATSGGYGPLVAHRDVAGAADFAMPEPEPGPSEVPPELLPAIRAALGARAGAPVVELGEGVLVAPPGGAPDFKGFARPASTYAIPINRFKGDKRAVARALLEAAERAWAGAPPDDRALFAAALAQVEAVGYPPPGCAASDGDVVAAWKRGAAFFALVRLRLFPAGVAVAVRCVEARPPEEEAEGFPPVFLKDMADIGRDLYRDMFLQPRAAHVHR